MKITKSVLACQKMSFAAAVHTVAKSDQHMYEIKIRSDSRDPHFVWKLS